MTDMTDMTVLNIFKHDRTRATLLLVSTPEYADSRPST